MRKIENKGEMEENENREEKVKTKEMPEHSKE